MYKFLLFIINFILFISCQTVPDDYAGKLEELDEIIEQQPRNVLDSLKKIKVSHLQKPQKAYYFLLKAIANDKNLIYNSQDSTLLFSRKYYESISDHYNLARTLYYLSKISQRQDKKEIAYDQLKQAELHLKQDRQPDPHQAGLIYYQLARLQNTQNNLPEAEYYSEKALQSFLNSQDTISAVHALKLLGQIATNKKQFSKAQEYLIQGLNLLNRLEKTDKKTNEVKAGILNSLSILCRNISDIPKALAYARACIEISLQNNKNTISSYYHSIMLAFLKQNQLDSAKYYCSLMIDAAQKGKKINTINGYKLLAEIAQKEGNYQEACFYWQQFNIHKDSLNENTNRSLTIELDKKYNLAEKERQLLKLENEKLRSYIFISVTVIIILLISIPLYNRHRKLKTDYKQLSENVKHTEWGFSVTKELIAANNHVYEELEQILNRYRVGNVNSEIYNRFQNAFIRQKANYSSRLIAILTDFDEIFIKKFQKKFPQFSSDDTLMAAMVRHRWKVTDIAAVFHVSPEAIRKRKSRLAKKISTKLQTNITLDEYLNEL